MTTDDDLHGTIAEVARGLEAIEDELAQVDGMAAFRERITECRSTLVETSLGALAFRSAARSTDDDRLLEAQGHCRGCGGRYLFLTSPKVTPGTTTQTSTYCQCEEPHENVVTVVYDPDEYDLVDTYGDGRIGLRATCEDCGVDLYGPVEECPDCGGEAFDRWLDGDRDA